MEQLGNTIGRKKPSSKKTIDWIALIFVAGSWIVTLIFGARLGLYSDDYWNLFEANRLTWADYLSNHLTHINSRYTYAVTNKVMSCLFYQPEKLFGMTYIHATRVLLLSCHFLGVWFAYSCLSRFFVPKPALLCLLPFISFPIFADQAIFWNAAGFAYSVGFCLFFGSLLALMTGRKALFALLMFFALGATEFIILPGLIAIILYAFLNSGREKQKNNIRLFADLLMLYLPYLLWALVVMSTSAAASRDARIHGNPKLLGAPVAWLSSYLSIYAKQLLPMPWMREYGYVVFSVLTAAIVFIKQKNTRLQAIVLIAMYFLSILPVSAVGYTFYPISHARLWYFPGVFFYIAFFSIVGYLCRDYIDTFAGLRPFLFKWGIVVPMTFALIYFGAETKMITDEGRRAFGCVRGFLEHVRGEANGRMPKRVEVCGIPPALHNFSIFRSPYGGPYAMSLLFRAKTTIPFSYKPQCPRNWGALWRDERCLAEAKYKILYKYKGDE